jgi:hypothetical protein
MSADNYSKGMLTIERVIIQGMSTIGRHVTAANFTWNHGQVAVVVDMTDLEVRFGRGAVVGIFSMEEIEDAAFLVNRPETLKTIQRIITDAGQLLPL